MREKKSITIFLLTMINLATILSVRNWPMAAEYGLASVGFLLLAVIFFFIPSALVSAELATGWPHQGGIFVWVKEALGHRLGFLAVWLLWIENVVWYPTILSFIAASLAYAFKPELASNNWYEFVMIIGIFWIVTYANLGGMKLSGWISTGGMIFGTLLPGLLIIILGATWMGKGFVLQIDYSWKGLMPDLSHFSELAYLSGIVLSFCGMEMSAVHAKDVVEPQKNYPKAIFLSGFIIVISTILGTLAIATVIPQKEINLVSGSIEAIYQFLSSFGLKWMIPTVAILVAVGALGGVSTWTAGPCRGLLAAAQKGDFPPLMHKSNRHGMPVNLMIMQAIIVSSLAMVFIFMPNVSSSFWILTVLASQLYMIMYLLMFISAIVLRYKMKDVTRNYRIPFGNVGMWIVSSMGIIGTIFVIVIGFFPPSSLDLGEGLFFELFLAAGILICCSIPFLLYHMKSEKWGILPTDEEPKPN